MKTLLLLEWMKVRKYKTFWAFIILFAISLAGINYFIHNVQIQTKSLTHGMANIQIFSFPQIWSTTAWAGGFSVLLLGILIITLVTNEYSFKTHRQQIIDGISRKQFISGKWLTIIVFIIFTWISYFILTLIVGNHTENISVFSGFDYAGYFLVKMAVSLSVAFMFALLFRRSGLAIALYLVYVFILEGIIKHFLDKIAGGLGMFLPLSAGGYLVSNPMRQAIPGIETIHIQPVWILLTCLGYLILFVYLSYRYINHADL